MATPHPFSLKAGHYTVLVLPTCSVAASKNPEKEGEIWQDRIYLICQNYLDVCNTHHYLFTNAPTRTFNSINKEDPWLLMPLNEKKDNYLNWIIAHSLHGQLSDSWIVSESEIRCSSPPRCPMKKYLSITETISMNHQSGNSSRSSGETEKAKWEDGNAEEEERERARGARGGG